MLSGLGGVAWEALHHAYGPADDLPAVIRAAASTDEQEARGAVEELFSSVFHQGTVYPASVAVVPFVAELAVSPAVHHRHLLMYLLGGMADPGEANGPDVAAVGSALAAQVPRLLPLLADPDPQVREAAAYTLAQCPEMAGLVVARLRERWAVEDVALVRASLLAAGGRLDPAGCGQWLSEALDDRQAAVRAAAALAIVWAGLPWPDRGMDAVIPAFADGDPLRGWVWATGDSLAELLEPFDEVGGVPAEVVNALVHAPSVEARHEAAYAVYALDKARRSSPARLLPLLAPLLADADEQVRRAAANTVRIAGSAGVLVADKLAALAAGCADHDESDGWAAAEALRALIQLRDPRWRAPLLAAWRAGTAPADAGQLLADAGVAVDPELLAAVRGRLAAIHGESMLTANERAGLVWLLGSWGPAATPAIPELLVALEHGWGTAPRALLAIGPAAAAALPALRAAASRGGVAAAVAVWRLADEPELLLGAVGRAVDHDQFYAPAIDKLVELGEHARPLLGRLQRLLTGEPARTFPARDAQMAAARVVWRLTADPDAVLPTVRAVLAAGGQPAGTAASLAAELGIHARPLVPLLRRTLNERWASVHAAHALWRLGDNPCRACRTGGRGGC
jgi:HEAT repeat